LTADANEMMVYLRLDSCCNSQHLIVFPCLFISAIIQILFAAV